MADEKYYFKNVPFTGYALFIIFLFFNTIKILFFYMNLINYEVSFTNLLFHSVLTFLFVLIYFWFFVNMEKRRYFILIYSVQFIYILVNMTYFFYFKQYLNVHTASSLSGDVFLLLKKWAIPFELQLFVLFIDVPALFFLLKSRILFSGFNIVKALLSLIVILIISFSLFYIFQFRSKRTSIQFGGESKVVFEYGLLYYQIKDYLSSNGDKMQSLTNQLKPSIRIVKSPGSNKKSNFIFIQVESMESHIISTLHNGRLVMPYLFSLTTNSVYYPYVLSYHKGGGTSDVEVSILNSIEPLDNYPTIKMNNYNYENSMVKVLKNCNYQAFAFHGNEGSFWNRAFAFKQMGFDAFNDIYKMKLRGKRLGSGG